MQKINNEKGITLVILVITIIVLILISVPVVVNTVEIVELQKYTNFKSDIDELREGINSFYMDISTLATIGPRYTGDLSFLNGTQNGVVVRNPNDDDNYYVISLNELNSHMDAQIDLEYGSGNKIEDYASLDINQGKDPNNTTIIQYEYQGDDTYIINGQTRTIYYTSGVEYKGEIYHRLPEDFTALSVVYTVIYDSNGGDTTPDMQTVDSTGTDTITLRDAPQRSGYVFSGWKDEKNDEIYQAGDTYTVTQSTKMIAQWENE